MKPRRPGRPNRDDAARDTREQLLDAGLASCVEQGIAGTTLRDVAKRAGLTPALLHYYFADKSGLVEAVASERVLPVIDALGSDSQSGGQDPATIAIDFVDSVFALVERFPWLPGLWVREVLASSGGLRQFLLQHVAERIPRPLARQFAAAQQAGRLAADIEPRLLVVSLIGLSLFPLAAAPLWQGAFNDPALGRERLRQHTHALLRAALEPRDEN
ncbi:MAG TPA: TetR/AcrR family transcriptional regulator [Arenimonas sp.]|nr:TetR/AcrR family transcriptional regulator [Arenimonas sp.]